MSPEKKRRMATYVKDTAKEMIYKFPEPQDTIQVAFSTLAFLASYLVAVDYTTEEEMISQLTEKLTKAIPKIASEYKEELKK